MPKPTRKELIDAMIALGVKKEDAENCLDSNHAYIAFIKQLNEKDSHGLTHVMTPDDYQQLQIYYNLDLENTNNVLNTMRNSKAALGSRAPEIPEFINKMHSVLLKDYNVVRDLCKNKTAEPYEVACHKINNKVLQGSFANNQTLGANMSTRFAMEVKDSNGVVRKGVFTKKLVRPEIVSSMTTSHSMISLDEQLGLLPGERIDSRNSAMSDIAELLGRKDLLAHSEDLKVEHNGVIMEGSFMDFVEGTDTSNYSMQKDKLYFDMDMTETKPFFTSKAAKDILDLSVLDLVCQNFDRHAGNIIYQYKQTNDGIKLDGIVGIDNDTSLGSIKMRNNESFNRLQSMDNTVVVTEQMADYILKITPTMVMGTLSKYKLADKAKRDTFERVHEMQERIKRGMQFSNQLKEEPLSELGKQFLTDPIGKVKDKSINPDPSQKIMVIVPNKLLDKVNIREIGKKCEAKDGDDLMHAYGVCNMVSSRHTTKMQALQRMVATNEAKKVVIRNAPLAEKTRDTKMNLRNFANFMKNQFIDVQDIEPKNEELKQLHHDIIGQMARIEKKARTLGDDAHVMGKNDLNRLSLYCKDLKKKCAGFSLKCSELTANKTRLRSADKDCLKAVQKLNLDVGPFMNEIRMLDDMELLSKNVNIAKQADALATLNAKRRINPEIDNAKLIIEQQISNPQGEINRNDLAADVAKLMYFGTLKDNMYTLGAEKVDTLVADVSIHNNLKKVTDMVKEYMDELPSNEAICEMLKPENFQEGFVAGFRLYANLVKEENKKQAEISTDIEINGAEKKATLKEQKIEKTLEAAFPGMGIR